ncbi:YbaB/EbfC family nucleoid-associated protein [Actinokineospora sp.]|uniref:YbaB/EbfC family nucleoid-associated protein n=1 Tax=Actinokineospora sp. TaxID=1872133 RepID=UPI003D6A5C09
MTDQQHTAAELAQRATAITEQAEQIYSRTLTRKETLRSTRDAATRVTAEAKSGDRSVRATVDAGGMVTELALTHQALAMSPDDLAAVIIGVAQEAAGKARESVYGMYVALQNEGMIRELPVLPPAVKPTPSERPVVENDRDESRSGFMVDEW